MDSAFVTADPSTNFRITIRWLAIASAPGPGLLFGFTMATIAILGTMDTKGEEHAFVAEQIRKRGHKTLVIDTGTLEEPKLKPDITRAELAAAAGVDLAALVARRDRGEAVKAMSEGAPLVLVRL